MDGIKEQQTWQIDFRFLQKRLPAAWQSVWSDPLRARTVVVVPSISLPPLELAKVPGSVHYEERLLSFLTLLGMAKTHVIYVTALPIPDEVISYYLQFLPGVTFSHARERLHIVSLMDRSDRPLTQKILERPPVIERIKREIVNPELSYMEVYYNTDLEHELAVKLGIPIWGATEDLHYWNTKTGTREIFSDLNIAHPKGKGNIYTLKDAAQALLYIVEIVPGLDKAVIKLNEGLSGIGNIVINMKDLPSGGDPQTIEAYLQSLPEDYFADVPWSVFLNILADQGGVVEAFIQSKGRTSPTIQLFINPDGEIIIDSTHEQILGGSSGIEYKGCTLPAKREYSPILHELGLRIGKKLISLGALGPVSIDFLVLPEDEFVHAGAIEGEIVRYNGYVICAIEINMRRGGTTLPLHTTSFLTGGHYNADEGIFCTPSGHEICYVSFSNIAPPEAKGLCPNDIIDIITDAELHYNSAICSGVIFHTIGALSQYGRLGATCVAPTQERAWQLAEETRSILKAKSKDLSWIH